MWLQLLTKKWICNLHLLLLLMGEYVWILKQLQPIYTATKVPFTAIVFQNFQFTADHLPSPNISPCNLVLTTFKTAYLSVNREQLHGRVHTQELQDCDLWSIKANERATEHLIRFLGPIMSLYQSRSTNYRYM